MFDLVIKNAQVIDGLGGPVFGADVAVSGGKIVVVGVIDGDAVETIDADGLVAAPGFIDVHGHSDLYAIIDPDRTSKLCQGITTEICCMCGFGPAPVSDRFFGLYADYFKSFGVPVYPLSKGFTTFDAYMRFMDDTPLGINLAFFIPHGMVRMAVMGLSPDKPTCAELERMSVLVRDGMSAGALGLSSGLVYAPGIFASEDELTALCTVVGEFDGIYTTHLRNQGIRLEESVAESIRVASKAGARVNISHHKASGKGNWGKVSSTIKMIHDADISVMHDVYPYTAGASNLLSTLPHFIQKMSHDEIIAYLSDDKNRETLRDAIFNPAIDFESPLADSGYDGFIIFDAAVTKDAIGKSVAQYAEELGLDPFKVYLKILTDNRLRAGYIGFSMDEADVRSLMADPLCMFGTDALYVQGMQMTHPRAIGSFPRILGRYVREAGLLTLEEAIRKMTSLPAQFYGLRGKGVIREGMDADIVVFDPGVIIDHADFKQPLLPNEGLVRVIVGGEVAVINDIVTGVLQGHVLRRSI